MIVKECKHCGKKIEGYTKKHVNQLLSQHLFGKHPNKYCLTERDAVSLGYKKEEDDD